MNCLDRGKYLAATEIIDWDHSSIQDLAVLLGAGTGSEIEIAKKCFEWVRDNIKHSHDHKLNPVTCKASDVLKYGTGYCYAKSHLLAALLRANGLPTGLCYQRLSRDDNGAPYCLHGLNAVYLEKFGWYRIDPRGNKPGINAQFCPPIERLAYVAHTEGEADLPGILPEPLEIVVDTLTKWKGYDEVYSNLPDMKIENK